MNHNDKETDMTALDQEDQRKYDPLDEEIRVLLWVIVALLLLTVIVGAYESIRNHERDLRHASAPQGVSVGGGMAK